MQDFIYIYMSCVSNVLHIYIYTYKYTHTHRYHNASRCLLLATDLLMIAIVNGISWYLDFFKSQVGSGFKSQHLLGDFRFISLIWSAEASWNFWTVFSLDTISLFMAMVLTSGGKLEFILFQKTVLNLSVSSSAANQVPRKPEYSLVILFTFF